MLNAQCLQFCFSVIKMENIKNRLMSRRAITQTQTIVVVAILIIGVIAAVWYTTLPGPNGNGNGNGDGLPELPLTYTLMAAHWFIYEMGADPTFFGGANPAFMPLIYESLFNYDPNELKEGNFVAVPWLAESYTVSSDGLIYNIKLRTGIKFHFTGNEFTADDVIYMFNRAYFWPLEPGYPLDIVAAIDIPSVPWRVIDSVEKINDYEVQINLNTYFPTLPEFLGMMWVFGIVDSQEVEAHAVTGAGGLSDHGYQWLKTTDDIDVGTGPYKVKKFTMLQKYDLELIDDYWGGPADLNLPYPTIEDITMLAIIEDSDARMRLLVGDLNIASDLQCILGVSLQTGGLGRPFTGLLTTTKSSTM